MNENKTKNFISPVIFLVTVAMGVLITHLFARAAAGTGIYEPGLMSATLLLFLAIFLGSVWCTILYIGYQLHKLSNNE